MRPDGTWRSGSRSFRQFIIRRRRLECAVWRRARPVDAQAARTHEVRRGRQRRGRRADSFDVYAPFSCRDHRQLDSPHLQHEADHRRVAVSIDGPQVDVPHHAAASGRATTLAGLIERTESKIAPAIKRAL